MVRVSGARIAVRLGLVMSGGVEIKAAATVEGAVSITAASCHSCCGYADGVRRRVTARGCSYGSSAATVFQSGGVGSGGQRNARW